MDESRRQRAISGLVLVASCFATLAATSSSLAVSNVALAITAVTIAFAVALLVVEWKARDRTEEVVSASLAGRSRDGKRIAVLTIASVGAYAALGIAYGLREWLLAGLAGAGAFAITWLVWLEIRSREE